MIFSSKTPRDLNRDPLPYAGVSGGRNMAPYVDRGELSPRDPRPEFDHVQHNEPNPILLDIRRYRDARLQMNQPKDWRRVLQVFNSAADYGHFVTGEWETISDPHMIEHARKVLTRLVALEG